MAAKKAAQNSGDAEAAAHGIRPTNMRPRVDDPRAMPPFSKERAREDEAHHGEQRDMSITLSMSSATMHGDIGEDQGKGGSPRRATHENGAAHNEAEGHNNPKNGIGGHATPPPAGRTTPPRKCGTAPPLEDAEALGAKAAGTAVNRRNAQIKQHTVPRHHRAIRSDEQPRPYWK